MFEIENAIIWVPIVLISLIIAIIFISIKTHSPKPLLWVFLFFALTPIGCLVVYAILRIAQKD